MVDPEDFAEAVPEEDRTGGETTVRLDAGVVSLIKQEIGVSQNTELAPYVEAVLLESLDEQERAEGKVEEFKAQYQD